MRMLLTVLAITVGFMALETRPAPLSAGEGAAHAPYEAQIVRALIKVDPVGCVTPIDV